MIKWLLKWLKGKPVPKYLHGKKDDNLVDKLFPDEEAAKRDKAEG